MRSKTVTTMSKILATRLSSLVLIIALVLEQVVTDSDVLKFYPIPDLSNYSLPSTSSPFNMPPGCICAKTGMTATTCDTFACDCSCDLTAAACDAECCCDPECPHGDFVFDESCYKEFENLKSKSTVKMCFDHHARLEQLNPAFPLRVSDTIEDAMQNILCVEYDNSAIKGDYYISDASNIQYFDSLQSIDDLGISIQSEDSHYVHLHDNGTYAVGDRLVTFYSHENHSNEFFPALFYIYSPTDAGYCNQIRFAEFGRNMDFSCVTIIDKDLLQDLCSTILSVDQVVRDIHVSKFRNSTSIVIQDPIQRELWMNTIQVVSLLDSTGASINYTHVDTPFTQWNESSKTCENALKSIRFEFTYTPFGSIHQVMASIESFHVSELATKVSQRFSIQFTSTVDSSINKTWSNNNIVPRSRSGNPGYKFESITLGGVQRTGIIQNISRTYMDSKIQGLSVMSLVDGNCETALPEVTSVSFGVNMTIGCSLTLNRSELESFCTDTNHLYYNTYELSENSAIRVPRWFATDVNYIGIFGNADPLDHNQWVRINEQTYGGINQTWLSSRSSCIGLYSQLDYRIWWTFVGSKDHPQAKILRVSRIWNSSNTLTHKLHPRNREIFTFSSEITWTFVKSRSTAVKPPRPILLFTVPYDVFYPFVINNSFERVPHSMGQLIICFTIIMTVMLL